MKQLFSYKMLRVPFSLFSAMLLLSARPTGFVIRGHIDGIENGTKVYLYDIDAQVRLDSSITSQGNFLLKGFVTKPTTCWIMCKAEYAIIQVENTRMEFWSPQTNMNLAAKIKGGREQKLQNELTALQYPYDFIFYQRL